jgi:hypothetical protein
MADPPLIAEHPMNDTDLAKNDANFAALSPM